MINTFLYFFYLECLILIRASHEWIYGIVFFSIIIVLVPLAFSPELKFMQTHFSGYIWIACLLSALMTMKNFYFSETEDGFLETLCLSSSVTLYLYAKLIAHWLLAFLPILMLTPLLAYSIGINTALIKINMLGLLLGTPILVIVNAFGVTLTLGLRAQNTLLGLLVLPLLIPVLIFGINLSHQAALGLNVNGILALLGALFLITFSLLPVTMKNILKLFL